MRLFVFILVLGVLLVFVKSRNAREILISLGLGSLLMVAVLLVTYISMREPVVKESVAIELHVARTIPTKHHLDLPQDSTEQIWQHLTAPQIVLDSKSNEKPTEEIDLTEPEDTEPTRPAWVDLPPKQIGNVYRVAVSSGPYKTKPECYHALERLLGKEVRQRIEHLMPRAEVPDPAQLGITTEYILHEICNKNKTWVETTEASFGKMKQVHVQLEFTAATEIHLQTAFRNHQRQDRVAQVGGLVGLGLGSLALLYGLLKWTPRPNV